MSIRIHDTLYAHQFAAIRGEIVRYLHASCADSIAEMISASCADPHAFIDAMHEDGWDLIDDIDAYADQLAQMEIFEEIQWAYATIARMHAPRGIFEAELFAGQIAGQVSTEAEEIVEALFWARWSDCEDA